MTDAFHELQIAIAWRLSVLRFSQGTWWNFNTQLDLVIGGFAKQDTLAAVARDHPNEIADVGGRLELIKSFQSPLHHAG